MMPEINNLYNTAVYARLSLEDCQDKESDSIENQIYLAKQYIAERSYLKLCSVFYDDGKTGTNFDRPGFTTMMDEIEAGRINCIVVKDLSRFGRNYIETGEYLEKTFPFMGVRFIAINDGYDSASLNSGVVGIDIAFRNLVYELYSRDISQKTRQGKITATKKGKCISSAPVYGYLKSRADKRKLIIDEVAANVVIRIYDLIEQGLQPIQIAKLLNDEGVPSPKEHKIQLGLLKRLDSERITFWNSTTVSNIIHDERYTGKLIYGKMRVAEVGKSRCVHSPKNEWIVADNAIPVIITEERFNEINAIIPKKPAPKKNQLGRVLLFTGKLKCGNCGLSLCSYETKYGIKYYCRTSKLTKKYGCCSGDRLYEKEISEVVLATLQHKISIACEISNKHNDRSKPQSLTADKYVKELEANQKAIEKCKTAKISLWEKHHSKLITKESFRVENDKLDTQIQQYNDETDRVRHEIAYLETTKEEANNYMWQHDSYKDLQELTREVVVNLIEEIRVFSVEKIQIVFSFADEYSFTNY